MAKKEMQIDEDIIDLTELIEPGNAGSRAAAAYAKAAAPAPALDDDFDTILQDSMPPSTNHKVDPHESLDMSDMGGIDNLLESLDIPPQPRESGQKAQPGAEATDLDSVLDDLLAPPAKAAAPDPSPASAKAAPPTLDVSGLDDFDLDNLVDTPAAAPAAHTAGAQAEKKSDLDADLDDILASFDEPQLEKAPAPEKVKEELPETEMAADLDDILSEIDTPTPVQPAAPQEPKISARDGTPVEHPDGAMEDLPEDDVMEAEPQAAAGQDIITEHEPLIADAPAVADTFMTPGETGSQTGAEKIVENSAPPLNESQNYQTPHLPSHASLPAEVPGAEKGANGIAVQTWPADMIAGLCQGIANAQGNGARETIQEFSRELGAQSAHVQDMGGQLAQLAKRLLACESKIAAARARVASLEKGMEGVSALDDLLRAGTPLHAGFMALISSAVGNTLQNFMPPDQGEALAALESRLSMRMDAAENRMTELENLQTQTAKDEEWQTRLLHLEEEIRQSNARMAELAAKVDNLVASFETNMEKAAAQAVSQILQEEITKLLQE